MFKLKNYQERAISTMVSFLSKSRQMPVAEAYQVVLEEQGMPEHEYQDYGFGQIPYFCLRIPTGGGKTILGSYAIEVAARHFLDTETPIALWLVPTTVIREQTVSALKTPGHPYRARLDKVFNRQVLVLDVDEVFQIRPQDIGGKAIVVVSTLANLRVTDTSGRKVYAYNEFFEPHFAKITAQHPAWDMLERVNHEDLQVNGLTEKELGKVKYSFANLLAIHNPVVIVDEAHNARTSLTFETLKRVHPAAIIELTATPNMSNNNGSNVLFHTSAAELKAEEMIKLPIILTEQQTWQDAIRDAVITRNKLALDAQSDPDYIRPIALFQAEPKNREVTVDVLKEFLIEQLKIDESRIAIATGTQRELDSLNLFDPSCPIDYIITIEALKEGWDCSFAYVFCSVKHVSSSKDVEQLLGRVLRMPYAKRRLIEDLNRAYAHLLAGSSFSRTASTLSDTLIAMGFEAMEVAAFLRTQPPSPQSDLFGEGEHGADVPPASVPPFFADLPEPPDLQGLSDKELQNVTMSHDDDTNTTVVRVTGEVSPGLKTALLDKAKPGAARDKLERDIGFHNKAVESAKAPSELGKTFSPLPQLCLREQGELELIEPRTYLWAANWNLLDHSAELTGFSLNEKTDTFTIDAEGGRVKYRAVKQEDAVEFNQGFLELTELDLVRWLDKKLQNPDINQQQLVAYLALVVKKLLQGGQYTLTALVRNKFRLAQAISDQIKQNRKKVQKTGYQKSLFGSEPTVCLTDEFFYEFHPAKYPSRPPFYSGSYVFSKHFFPVSLIEDLKAGGEECLCAEEIDGLPEVKYWIRNLERREDASFWLPLAHTRFFPDFVCELHDGRMLVVEYKGKVYLTNDDSTEKRAVGNKWAELSNGRCLFVMVEKKDKLGRNMKQQLADAIG